MATLNLGRIKPVFRGAYDASTGYVVDDIVTSGNETFICILASTGNATSNATYWTKLAAKGTDGTNGTDVGTVITTEGDILYRDGSGLQRLAKPASDMYLKNTSAGAVSWSALSSDCVKLAYLEGDAVNVTGVDVTGYFDDTKYHSYKFEISELQFHASYNPQFSFLDSSGNQIDSNNYLALHTGYTSSSGSGNGSQNRSYWNQGAIQDLEGTWGNYQSAGDYDYASMQGTIYSPQSTSYGKKMDYQFNSMSIDGGVQVCANGTFYHHTNSAVNGFRVRGHSQNTRRYKMALYGMKK